VAGTVAGLSYGAAKGASVVAIRVLDCSGSGSTSGIIASLDWIETNFVSPAVVTMSLGGSFSASMNAAVDSLVDAGVVVVRPPSSSPPPLPVPVCVAFKLPVRLRTTAVREAGRDAALTRPGARDPRWWLPVTTRETHATSHRRARCRR